MKRLTYQKPLRDAVIATRVPAELRERVYKMEKQTHIPANAIVQDALDAACRYVERHGEIRMPLQLCSSLELEKLRAISSGKKAK